MVVLSFVLVNRRLVDFLFSFNVMCLIVGVVFCVMDVLVWVDLVNDIMLMFGWVDMVVLIFCLLLLIRLKIFGGYLVL